MRAGQDVGGEEVEGDRQVQRDDSHPAHAVGQTAQQVQERLRGPDVPQGPRRVPGTPGVELRGHVGGLRAVPAQEHLDVEQDGRVRQGTGPRRGLPGVGRLQPATSASAAASASERSCRTGTTTSGWPCGLRGVIDGPFTEKNSPAKST